MFSSKQFLEICKNHLETLIEYAMSLHQKKLICPKVLIISLVLCFVDKKENKETVRDLDFKHKLKELFS